MVRFPLLFLILLAAFGFLRGAGAQGVFDITPDTLYTDENGYGEALLVNALPDTVVLDSLTIRMPDPGAHLWEISTPDTVYSFWNFEDPPYGLTHTVDQSFSPEDTLSLSFWVDPCPICVASDVGWSQVDTLLIHSNGLIANDTLILDWANLIADEEGPEGKPSISLKAMPNPSAGLVEVQLSLAAASEVSVSIFDTRGRRIAMLQNGPLISGEHTLTWDNSETAPGIYYIRARTSGGAPLSRSVVVTR